MGARPTREVAKKPRQPDAKGEKPFFSHEVLL
jgi:hypothetical protein